jgi:hypothetical protein
MEAAHNQNFILVDLTNSLALSWRQNHSISHIDHFPLVAACLSHVVGVELDSFYCVEVLLGVIGNATEYVD